MQPGEGLVFAGVALALGLAGYAFLRGAQRLSVQWGDVDLLAIDRADAFDAVDPAELRAAALVPEYAAARMPRVAGRCGCRSCRLRRHGAPCSDFDGD